MDRDRHARRVMMDAPARYLIRVQGDLDARWLEYYGISIVVSNPVGTSAVSTICLHDSDQATVLGILNSLCDYGFPLLYLERLDA